ncbi:MAG: VTC domain-containing protein [Planctomycetaceae bacterium]
MPLPRRFELKYLLPERLAQAVCAAAAPFVQPDEHAAAHPREGYPVCSLYLDSPGLTLFRQTVDGWESRFKLRIRLYDSQPDSPVFCEIKRRRNQIIVKQRVSAPRDLVEQALAGQVRPLPASISPPLTDDAGAIWDEFWRLRDELHADGMTYVVYRREAYVGKQDDSVRVTFDRQLRGTPYRPGERLHVPTTGTAPPISGVVLELKFNERFPAWMHQLVQQFGLERCSVPKYIKCVRSCRQA